MSVDPTAVFEAWEAQIRNSFPFPVYVSELPEDDELQFDSRGTMTPYIVLSFGGPVRSAGGRGIVSTRRDSQIVFLTVEVYAPTSDIARKLKGKIIDALLGYRVFSGGDQITGELTFSGGMSYSRSSNTIRPTQYIEAQSFQTVTNLIVGDVI